MRENIMQIKELYAVLEEKAKYILNNHEVIDKNALF